jgi:hypothetical protein
MRKLNIGTSKHTQVSAVDEPGPGGANHHYMIMPVAELRKMGETGEKGEIKGSMCINFQNGPVKENGVNGVHNEDLIAIVLDRLYGFQDGDYACDTNAQAIRKFEEGLEWLRTRTTDREIRGVEGTSQK